jgi:hypothetical protein
MSRRDCSGFIGRMKSSSIKEQIEDAYPDAEEYPPDVDQRMTEIESRLDQHNDQPRKYREEEMPLAEAEAIEAREPVPAIADRGSAGKG